MTLGGLRFRAPLIPSLAVLLLLPVLTSLGLWQLDRAEQKQVLLDRHAANAEDAPLRLDAQAGEVEAFRYRKAIATGRYLGDRQILLDNQVQGGRVGYHVFTPFWLEPEGGVVLVNRGWVALGASRAQLPEVPVAGDERAVSGMLNRPPSVGLRLESSDTPTPEGWPRVTPYLDIEQIGEWLGYNVLPMIMWLEPSEADGYVREWRILESGPEKHLGYAFQWFSLAAALLVIYLVVNVRRIERQSDL